MVLKAEKLNSSFIKSLCFSTVFFLFYFASSAYFLNQSVFTFQVHLQNAGVEDPQSIERALETKVRSLSLKLSNVHVQKVFVSFVDVRHGTMMGRFLVSGLSPWSLLSETNLNSMKAQMKNLFYSGLSEFQLVNLELIEETSSYYFSSPSLALLKIFIYSLLTSGALFLMLLRGFKRNGI
jgi:hypothetical protein